MSKKLLTVPAFNGAIFYNKARILINYFALGTSLQMYTVHILFFHTPYLILVKSELLNHTKADIPKCNLQKNILEWDMKFEIYAYCNFRPRHKGRNLFQIMNWYNWANISLLMDRKRQVLTNDISCTLPVRYAIGLPIPLRSLVHQEQVGYHIVLVLKIVPVNASQPVKYLVDNLLK